MKKKVIIIGGGAAGLIAAGKAAERDCEVIVYEKMSRPARKLRITGKGRCNLTNSENLHEFIEHFGKNGKFLHQAFNNFFNKDLVNFLEKLGVPIIEERGGRFFPKSGKAQDIVDALVKWAKNCGAKIITNSEVSELIIRDNQLCGIKLSGSKELISADTVIIATGGKSYSGTGSSGDGYIFAQQAGHKVTKITPALVPMEIEEVFVKDLSGLELKNIGLSILINNKKKKEIFGEMSFTDYGVSGPIILTVSKFIVKELEKNKKISIIIDLKPALDEKKLDNSLLRKLEEFKNSDFMSFLKKVLPIKIIPVFIKLLDIDAKLECNQITRKQRNNLRFLLKNFPLTIKGSRPIEEAIVTAGGVSLKEIEPNSMESKLVKGLFFIGEVLDLDADTGGYNLQAAFSTGWLAGISC